MKIMKKSSSLVVRLGQIHSVVASIALAESLTLEVGLGGPHSEEAMCSQQEEVLFQEEVWASFRFEEVLIELAESSHQAARLEGLRSEEANWVSLEAMILLVEVLGSIHSEEARHQGEELAK